MESSGETANLAVIENGAAVFVAQVPCRELMRMNARLGARAPLHASGVGKAMLAAMPARDADALVGREPLARYTERTLVSRPALAADARDDPPSATMRSTTKSTRLAALRRATYGRRAGPRSLIDFFRTEAGGTRDRPCSACFPGLCC